MPANTGVAGASLRVGFFAGTPAPTKAAPTPPANKKAPAHTSRGFFMSPGSNQPLNTSSTLVSG